MLKCVKLEYVNLCNKTLKQCLLLSFKTIITNVLKWSSFNVGKRWSINAQGRPIIDQLWIKIMTNEIIL